MESNLQFPTVVMPDRSCPSFFPISVSFSRHVAFIFLPTISFRWFPSEHSRFRARNRIQSSMTFGFYSSICKSSLICPDHLSAVLNPLHLLKTFVVALLLSILEKCPQSAFFYCVLSNIVPRFFFVFIPYLSFLERLLFV